MAISDCIICNPADGALLLDDSRGRVIIDDPVRYGHVLVAANVHVADLHALPAGAAAALGELIAEVASTVVRLTKARKTYAVAIGDKDPHYHFHIVPKFDSDDKLGPFVFGGKGWAGALEDANDEGKEALLGAFSAPRK